MQQAIILAICIACIAFTLTKGSIFSSLRTSIIMRSLFFGKLIQCTYCTSHWVAFPIMIFFHPRLVTSMSIYIDYIVSYFALEGMAAIVAGIIFKLFKSEE